MTLDDPYVATFASATVAVGQPPDLVAVVHGDIDIANAELIGRFIAQRCRGPVDRLTIDLTATRYIDSAGLAMLLDLADRLDASRTPLTVVAPPGTAAHRVISLTGLTVRLDRVDSVPPSVSSDGHV